MFMYVVLHGQNELFNIGESIQVQWKLEPITLMLEYVYYVVVRYSFLQSIVIPFDLCSFGELPACKSTVCHL